MKSFANRTETFEDSIFAVMSQKAIENKAINLAQGFPNFDGPVQMANSAKHFLGEGHNQYAPFPGVLPLRQAISGYYQKFYQLNYDPNCDVTVTVGATEAIFTTIMSLISPGDEVIIFEPYYDSYINSIKMAHGNVKVVTLKAPDFTFDPEELNGAVSSKTKLIILNNPNNPTGRVFTREELLIISDLALKNDLYVMSDEVYEFLTFDGRKHIPIASLPGMQERTITISSAGKTFGMTGWKIGWCATDKKIANIIRKTHQYITFSVTTPLQYAVAESLNGLESYVPEFVETYQNKRDLFYDGMKELGFNFPKPEGTYFMMVPIKDKTSKSDVDYCLELIEKQKVASIPPSAFYSKSSDGSKYLRFCFAKTDDVLKSALKNLQLF